MKTYMTELRKEKFLEDIEFLREHIKYLSEVIKGYTKLTYDKQKKYKDAYTRTLQRRQGAILQLKELLNTYEKQKEAEEYFSKIKQN